MKNQYHVPEWVKMRIPTVVNLPSKPLRIFFQ